MGNYVKSIELPIEEVKELKNIAKQESLDLLNNKSCHIWDKFEDINNAFGKYYQVHTFVKLHVYEEEGKEKIYIDHLNHYILANGVYLRPYKPKWNVKSFELSLKNRTNIQGIYSFYEEEKPNKIGKATTKKVEQWLEYLQKEEQAKKDYLNDKDEERQKFLQKLEPYKDKIVWQKENEIGYIENGNLLYSFKCEKNHTPHTEVYLYNRHSIEIEDFMKAIL